MEPSAADRPEPARTLADLCEHLGTDDWSGIEDWVSDHTDDTVFVQVEGDEDAPEGIIVISGGEGTLVEFPLDVDELIHEIEAAEDRVDAVLAEDEE